MRVETNVVRFVVIPLVDVFDVDDEPRGDERRMVPIVDGMSVGVPGEIRLGPRPECVGPVLNRDSGGDGLGVGEDGIGAEVWCVLVGREDGQDGVENVVALLGACLPICLLAFVHDRFDTVVERGTLGVRDLGVIEQIDVLVAVFG